MTLQFLFFFRELVIIGQLLPREDFSQGKDDDVLAAHDVHNLAVAVGLKWREVIINPPSNNTENSPHNCDL